MLQWIAALLLLGGVGAFFGFGGIAGVKLLFVRAWALLILVLFAMSLIVRLARR